MASTCMGLLRNHAQTEGNDIRFPQETAEHCLLYTSTSDLYLFSVTMPTCSFQTNTFHLFYLTLPTRAQPVSLLCYNVTLTFFFWKLT